MAVTLWPGDFLLINPQEMHSISSHCRTGDKIFCILSYLKMGVVGLSDISNPVVLPCTLLKILTSIIKILENSIVSKNFSFCIFMSSCSFKYSLWGMKKLDQHCSSCCFECSLMTYRKINIDDNAHQYNNTTIHQHDNTRRWQHNQTTI